MARRPRRRNPRRDRPREPAADTTGEGAGRALRNPPAADDRPRDGTGIEGELPPEEDGVLMDVRPGYKQTEVGVIPENWEVKSFAQLFAFRNGVNADKRSYGRGIRFVNVLEPITYSHL